MRSFETQDLKSFRMRSYKKTGRGEGPNPVANPLRVSANSAPLRYPFSLFFSSTHYSLLTPPIFCHIPPFLLSSAPQGENDYVRK
jgi:hypothetical protein